MSERGRPRALVVAILLNLVGAAYFGYMLASGGHGYLQPGFPPRWQVALGTGLWVIGAAGLWRRRRWGWYLTVTISLIAAAFVSFLAFAFLFFHGTPSLRDVLSAEALVVALLTLLAWGMVISLFHPRIRRPET
jgi:hypothetical protein